MNTIRKLTILNLLAAAVLSCTGVELTPQPIGDSPVPVEVVFSIPDDGPGTRSSYQALGSSVDDVNLWIVSDGTVIHHSFLEGQTTMALVLTAGRNYSFYALANTRGGYCSDMTRTVAVSHYTDEMAQVYQIVLDAQRAGIEAARAGVRGRFVDHAARKVIADAGYGEYFGHSFGHGIGLDIHELPLAAPSGMEILKSGNIISAEPGIYLPGKFGVRIEDMLLITENGSENLTKAPKQLTVCG